MPKTIYKFAQIMEIGLGKSGEMIFLASYGKVHSFHKLCVYKDCINSKQKSIKWKKYCWILVSKFALFYFDFVIRFFQKKERNFGKITDILSGVLVKLCHYMDRAYVQILEKMAPLEEAPFLFWDKAWVIDGELLETLKKEKAFLDLGIYKKEPDLNTMTLFREKYIAYTERLHQYVGTSKIGRFGSFVFQYLYLILEGVFIFGAGLCVYFYPYLLPICIGLAIFFALKKESFFELFVTIATVVFSLKNFYIYGLWVFFLFIFECIRLFSTLREKNWRKKIVFNQLKVWTRWELDAFPMEKKDSFFEKAFQLNRLKKMEKISTFIDQPNLRFQFSGGIFFAVFIFFIKAILVFMYL